MAKKKQIEELEDEITDDVTSDASFRDYYEDRFREWLDSDVELHSVTNPYRIKSVREAAKRSVDYFTRQSELGRPITFSGIIGAWKLGTASALDLYKTHHPEFETLINEVKLVAEEYAEEALFGKNSSGPKFILMNRNKWSNREIQEVTNHNIDVTIGNAGSQL